MTLRVGVHPNNLHLLLAQSWPGALRNIDAEFIAYPEGRDTGRLLAEGRFDVGGTGSTPPIITQVEGIEVLYIAASAPRPANGAILVREASPFRKVSDLAGARVALLNGSFHTYLLARVVEEAGLGLKDVQAVELAPAPSYEALRRGEVDAWIAMAPHLDQALASGDARMLVPCGSTIPNRSVFWTIAQRGLTAAQAQAFTVELMHIGREISHDLDRAARILSDLKIGDADFANWRKAIASRDWSIVPATAEVVAEQQTEADTLFRHGVIARTIETKAAVPLSQIHTAAGSAA